jgi:hypothetical protein
MSWTSLGLLALLTASATPPMTDVHEDGIAVRAPDSWRVLVDPEARNITMSKGLFTSITMYWYRFRKGATHDVVLDIVLNTTRDSLPIGSAEELSRTVSPDGQTAELVAEYSLLGYRMNIGVVSLLDEPRDRIVAAVLLSDPTSFASLDAMNLLDEVARSLHLDDDPRYLPDPRAPGPELVWRAVPEDMPLP